MAEIFYPHDYLPMPLQEGYGFQPVSPLKRTQLTTGRARQRRAYTSTPTEATVSWFMESDVQGLTFESWYRDALSDGAAWFMMKLQTPAGIKFYKCRFTDIYQGPVLVAPIYWRYSATLELWERPLLPPPWGNYPGWIAGSSLLDIALNREWPKHDGA
ncbi:MULTISPECIES: membrane protein [Klebsiella]|uniref:Alkanesulfonate ABC transporter membrane protein n=1 Tax=Klebsiella aerogenes (strain ATCC 13048 / DSM 30053 / CCUG 1429 / JCM 1235 / KCTC 2190 / NBRC 13534 / NCIMB 10102 / NCTC 10006 / CDC 819-56) TaxID=1028307 RepID=A0A0H3G1Q6_KLEAK|nr:membrane protein [Klebsiella aerogenes]AEG99109.1 alkanesulfonate ABC transporter membrane protein [Klebsiella aerogenes KCTC 2190]EIW9476302.1 hypothetical protein [Klebsiella aerogenes]EIW9496505.1 hypothetical protein [Klebsiella aerogenes]EKM7512187.1 hypothetical protein [Klebsiella aerogenes]ELJ2009617.1 hypothetical protein [Klebsiella aerogenes]